MNDEIYCLTNTYSPLKTYNNEFGSFSDGWIWDEYLIYDSVTEIQLYSKDQIQLFINMFYAYHGYQFKSKQYLDFFMSKQFRFYSSKKDKYLVNPSFSGSDFNEIERANIDWLIWLRERLYP